MTCLLVLSWLAAGGEPLYELRGRVLPEARATLALQGVNHPYAKSALSDSKGRFRFRNLKPGSYSLLAGIPGRGESRLTVQVGKGVASSDGRVEVAIEVKNSGATARAALERRAQVSAGELSVPESAWRAYAAALRELEDADAAGAVAQLERAVRAAPQFAAAWNLLGTLAYQTRRYADAEKYFRRALAAEPTAFEPLLNLGGVLLTLGRPREALELNREAAERRPDDALAQSQLGVSWFALGRLDEALAHLQEAKRLDPGHFSKPQLVLAEIHLRRKDAAAALAEVEDFLKRHPDAPEAAKLRALADKLKAEF